MNDMAENSNTPSPNLTRRHFLGNCSLGVGSMALSSLLGKLLLRSSLFCLSLCSSLEFGFKRPPRLLCRTDT